MPQSTLIFAKTTFFNFSCFWEGVLHLGEQERLQCTARPRFWAASSTIQAQVSSTAFNTIFSQVLICFILQAFWALHLLFTQRKAANLGEFPDLLIHHEIFWWQLIFWYVWDFQGGKLCNSLVLSIENEDGWWGDEACSQVFVNQLSALPCQNLKLASPPVLIQPVQASFPS